ncbi:conserved hypothetical protein [Verticillium alfalfae VaMs.102]|uniref:Uncharacterized protein n=1 Tax=Verticillium alfalfae (strain VaMs.102 / ATCC MYA-4576 / FGSC 10136) TaxID=526221 RepID=C9SGC5_VERA1|nr:conserved hypothetical protein [Verticillium alfalfae VaMs.102]EEY17465.1 conserved hypothetical protein [Verticillium alfalfae VaMs.102]
MPNPLVTGGVMDGTRYPGPDEGCAPPNWFISCTPPVIEKDTIIVAATSPNVIKGHQKEDGWFLSDFYAFNYLLHGLGSSQTWLTAALLKADPRFPVYLHGNPYQERKVVLSNDLLKSGELTRVTVVRSNNMIAQFLREVRQASKQAVKQQVPLLLLVFCHGLPNLTMLLDCGEKSKGITPTTLDGAIEPGCRYTVYTTACHSGGWVVKTTSDHWHSPLNTSMLAAASRNTTSNAWQDSRSISRACGSVFASAVIEALTCNSTPLIDSLGDGCAGDSNMLQPTEPSDTQTATYNTFCDSILTCCADRVHRLWYEQEFTFSAQNDHWGNSWTGRSGIPLGHFEQRWNKLPTVGYNGPSDVKALMDPHPGNPTYSASTDKTKTGVGADTEAESLIGDLIESICHNRLKVMAALFLQTCPGDWDSGWGPITRGGLWLAMEENPIHEPDFDPVAMITFRWELAQIADDLVRRFQLPVPAQQCCLLWDYSEHLTRRAKQGHKRSERGRWVYTALVAHEVQPVPTDEQGYPFERFTFYLTAAIVEADLDDGETKLVVEGIADHMRKAKAFHEMRALRSPNVIQRAREWLRSVGKELRDLSKDSG